MFEIGDRVERIVDNPDGNECIVIGSTGTICEKPEGDADDPCISQECDDKPLVMTESLLRPPYYSNPNYFCFVDTNGTANYDTSRNSFGLAPAFCF